jgi:hypothetical protein
MAKRIKITSPNASGEQRFGKLTSFCKMLIGQKFCHVAKKTKQSRALLNCHGQITTIGYDPKTRATIEG